jgi:hypothetical protein
MSNMFLFSKMYQPRGGPTIAASAVIGIGRRYRRGGIFKTLVSVAILGFKVGLMRGVEPAVLIGG